MEKRLIAGSVADTNIYKALTQALLYSVSQAFSHPLLLSRTAYPFSSLHLRYTLVPLFTSRRIIMQFFTTLAVLVAAVRAIQVTSPATVRRLDIPLGYSSSRPRD